MPRWTSTRRSMSCWWKTTRDCALSREILRWQGYQVDEAADGAESLAVAAAAQPDVIVTDLSMQVMDGATFIQRCRMLPGLDHVPIIVMSAMPASR